MRLKFESSICCIIDGLTDSLGLNCLTDFVVLSFGFNVGAEINALSKRNVHTLCPE